MMWVVIVGMALVTMVTTPGGIVEKTQATLNSLTASADVTGRFLNVQNLEGMENFPVDGPETAQPYPATKEYDFIIIGAGSAGSAIFNRLSENPNWNILLIEAGGDAPFFSEIPLHASLMQFTDNNWGYYGEKQANMSSGLRNQMMPWPRGRGLGGTSLINYMLHIRGNKYDYDLWAKDGNPGWDFDGVLPYFKKLEDCRVRNTDSQYRGRGGPVTCEDPRSKTGVVDPFIQSAIEAGHTYVDYNGADQMGVSYIQGTTRNGARCSGEKAYIREAKTRPNVDIMSYTRVTKILLDSQKNAIGVQFVKNSLWWTLKARKEVILSAGTFHSPQLLMLSGIGPASHLKQHGIPVVKDLPVGRKMYDHLCFLGLVFTVDTPDVSLDIRDVVNPINYFKFYVMNTGPLTNLGAVEALLYQKTKVSRETVRRADIEHIFIGGGLASDYGLLYRRMFGVSNEVYDKFFKPNQGSRQLWSVLPMLLHPKSVGKVELRSANPFHSPKLFGNFFTDPENLDIQTFIAGIREIQRIALMPTFQKMGTKQIKVPVPGCEQFTWDTDPYWECALRALSGTLHHQVATCKMGNQTDPEAVVDSKLNVYGIKKLRVADCSIIPRTLSAHTNIPAYMVGEKAADIIKQTYNAL